MHLQVPQEMAFSSLAAAAELVELGALGPPVEFPEGLSGWPVWTPPAGRSVDTPTGPQGA